MKHFIAISLLLTLFACHSSLQIVSAKKQTIIPGVKTAKPYTKYLIEFSVASEHSYMIDSVVAYDKEKDCRLATHFIRDLKMKNVIVQINTPGTYMLDATVKENSAKGVKLCVGHADKLTVYYSKNGKNKTLEINSFEEETIRRR